MEKSELSLLNSIVHQSPQFGGKRQLPEAMRLRVELNKKIAKDTKHEGMWIPIIKTVSWITSKSKETDGIKKVKEATKYYENHKDECIKKYEEFNREYQKNPTRKGSKKAKRLSKGGKGRRRIKEPIEKKPVRRGSRKSSKRKTSRVRRRSKK